MDTDFTQWVARFGPLTKFQERIAREAWSRAVAECRAIVVWEMDETCLRKMTRLDTKMGALQK